MSNLMRTIAHAPGGLRPFAAFGEYCRYGTQLTEKQRELAILVVLRDVSYGWHHHAPLGLAAGLTQEQLALIREGRAPRDLDPIELTLCEFAFEITAWRRPPPRIEEAVHGFFSPRQIVDFALLVSYYMSVAAMSIVLDVGLEAPEVFLREQAWQAEYGGGFEDEEI
ncbi:MAG: carboxymuconolactone decarboxylase family protein [Rhodospirillales bacterium]